MKTRRLELKYPLSGIIFGVLIFLIIFSQVPKVHGEITEWWSDEALVGNFNDGGYPMNVIIRDNYAYIAEWNEGLEILDISDPTNPTEVGQINAGVAVNLDIADNCIILATSNRGLQFVNISTPSNPTILTQYNENGTYYDVKIKGDYAYALEYYKGLEIIDISDLAHPSVVGTYYGGNFGFGLDIDGNYAYLANGLAGLIIVDISNPSQPTKVGEFNGAGQEIDVTIAGNYAFAANGWNGLKIVDISDPTHPVEVGGFSEGDLTHDICVLGNYAYLAYVDLGLKIFDIRNPANPFKVAQYDNEGSGKGLWVEDNYLYMADSINGLEILNLIVFQDFDADQIPDGYETYYHLNFSDPNDALLDPDSDGLTNLLEYRLGLNYTDSDTDDDGLPDGWEYQMGLNGNNPGDSNLDKDSDGITNLQEYLLGLNATSPDSDGDSMPDGWELENGCDPLSNDAKQDPDWDGRPNLREFLKQSDPHQFNFDAPVFIIGCTLLFLVFLVLSNHQVNLQIARDTIRLQEQINHLTIISSPIISEKIEIIRSKMARAVVYGRYKNEFAELQCLFEQKALNEYEKTFHSESTDIEVNLRDMFELREKIKNQPIVHYSERKEYLLTQINNLISRELTPKIKKVVIELAELHRRLEIAEIAEVCGIKDFEIVIDVVLAMIGNGEIKAQYFTSTQTIVFTQHVGSEDLERLDDLFKQWDQKDERNPQKKK